MRRVFEANAVRAVRLATLPLGFALLLGVAVGACRSGGVGPLDARFVAVHNALSAMGLSQIGPLEEGTLRAGGEARSLLSLPAGCIAIVALGGEGVKDLDAALVDARGKTLAHDTTTDPEAVLRLCLDVEDTYVLVIKAAAGEGSWVAATWAGGFGATAPAPSAAAPPASAEANGTCDAPIPLAAGANTVVTGSTAHGQADNAGSCGPSDSRELVYALDVVQRARVTIEVEARFDSVLYVRKDDCHSAESEVACSDDAPDRAHSKIERVFDPGKYFVFVDGYGEESGTFKMTVSAKEVLALSDVCRKAPLLAAGPPQAGTTASMADNAEATCGSGAAGADAPWRLELDSRSRVRIVEHADQGTPVVHIRRACTDEESEVACGEGNSTSGDATVTATMAPGAYTVFADAQDLESAGRYTLNLETAPPSGTTTASDGCGDAAPLPPGPEGSVAGDTFTARDDVSGTCGGAGAPDVVYRLEVPRRSRLVATLEHEEATHLLVLWRRCAERSAEVGCGPALNEVLEPGTYFVGVDGDTPSAFGRFSLRWTLRDLTDQRGECASAPLLERGRPLSVSTAGARNGFDTSCAANGIAKTGPDRVFRLALTEPATVRVLVTAHGFDAEVELRMACADPAFGRLPDLSCEATVGNNPQVVLERALEPGTYWVVVDGRSPKDQGAFTIEYRIVPS